MMPHGAQVRGAPATPRLIAESMPIGHCGIMPRACGWPPFGIRTMAAACGSAYPYQLPGMVA